MKFLTFKGKSMLFAFSAVLFGLFSCEPAQEKPAEVPAAEEAFFMQNAQRSGFADEAGIEKSPEISWKFQAEGPVISSPIIAEGTVYVGSEDHNMYALDKVSGALKWKFTTGGPVSSSAAVSGGKVLFLSYDGFFYALNAVDGSLAWKFATGGEARYISKDYYDPSRPAADCWDFNLSSAVVKDGKVFFGSSDSRVYALDLETGQKVWDYKTGGNIHSSPALFQNTLIIGSWDGGIYCLDLETGQEKWKYISGQDTAYAVMTGVQASPTVSDGVVFVGSRDAKIYAFDALSGDTLWTQNDFGGSWMPGSAAADSSSIYCGSSDAYKFYSVDKKTGKINYSVNTNLYTFSSPAIDRKKAYIGSANGRLYGINLSDGKLAWEFATLASRSDSSGIFDEKGVVSRLVMEEAMKNLKNMAEYKAFLDKLFTDRGAIFSSPALSEGMIYFGSWDGIVYALSEKK